MKKFSIILFVYSSFSGMSQMTFSKGYIINEKGDTIHGEVRVNPKKMHEVFNKVFFKDPSGLQKNYKPGKTRGYGVENERYITLDSDGEPAFYKIIVSGYINMYMLEFETIRMNSPVFENEYYLAYPGNKNLIIVKEGKFKKQITEIIKDNPQPAASYIDEKKFDPEKAAAVITEYNAWKATH